MKFEEFAVGNMFYTKDGGWLCTGVDKDKRKIVAIKDFQIFQYNKGNNHFCDFIDFEEKEFHKCATWNKPLWNDE